MPIGVVERPVFLPGDIELLGYTKIYSYPVPAITLGLLGSKIVAVTRCNTTAHGVDTNAQSCIMVSDDNGETWTQVATIDDTGDEARTGHPLLPTYSGRLAYFNHVMPLATSPYDDYTKVYEIDSAGNATNVLTIGAPDDGLRTRVYPLLAIGKHILAGYAPNLSSTSQDYDIIAIDTENWTYTTLLSLSTLLSSINKYYPSEASAVLYRDKLILFLRTEYIGTTADIRVNVITIDIDTSTSPPTLGNPTYLGEINPLPVSAVTVAAPTGAVAVGRKTYLLCYLRATTSDIRTYLLRLDLEHLLATRDVRISTDYAKDIQIVLGDEAANGTIILSNEKDNGYPVAYAVYESGPEGSTSGGNYFVKIRLDAVG